MERASSFNNKKDDDRASRLYGMEPLESRTLLSNWFVAPSGNDHNAGTLNSPWKTIQHAMLMANRNDGINLRAGTYTGELEITKPGLTIQAYKHERALLKAPFNNPAYGTAVRIALSADHTTLRNLDISGGYYYAVMTETNWSDGAPRRYGVSNILIEKSKIHDSGRDVIKISPGSDHVTIRDNQIYNSGRRDPSNAEGIDNVNGDYMRVERNFIHDITTNGVYAKGGAIGAVIINNRLQRMGFGGILLGQQTDTEFFDTATDPKYYENINGVVKNNTVIDAMSAGIGVYAASNALVQGNHLVNVARKYQGGILLAATDHYFPPTYRTAVYQKNLNPRILNNTIKVTSTRSAIEILPGSTVGKVTLKGNKFL